MMINSNVKTLGNTKYILGGGTMGFDRIEAVSLTDQFVQKIESMIISGELMPGDQLPPARELSARMGVSRPVISAGLIELEKMGFVEIVARQGVYVSDYRKTGSLDTLTALLNYNGGVMRDDEVRSLIEVRSANECLCVKLVVERATQDELDGLAPMLDAIKDAKTDQEGAEATFQFHHALSVLSRNTFLPLLYNSIHTYGLHFWSLYRKRYGANRLYQNKLELYRALLDRDAERAQAFTSDMLDGVANGAFSLYSHPDQTSHSEKTAGPGRALRFLTAGWEEEVKTFVSTGEPFTGV